MSRIGTTMENYRLKLEPANNSFPRRLITLAVIAVVGAGTLLLFSRTAIVKSRALNTVEAAGRGNPYFHFQNGKEMQVAYRGDQSLAAALSSGAAQPRAMASMDFDRDGTPDVVAGYSYNGGGLLTLQRGNPDAFAPRDDSVFQRLNAGYDPDSLLPTADTFPVPEHIDFLQVGDFNHDGQRDVLVAANGGGLYLLPGDADGGLRSAESIALPGAVTCMAAGEFRAPDGWTDVAVGINGPAGPELLVFDGLDGVGTETMRWSLPAPATAAVFGEIDGTPFHGVAVATGNQVEVIHGWGRKQDLSLASRVETISAGGNVRGLTTGFFVWTREANAQLATLTDDGTIQVLERGRANTQPFSDEELTARARMRLTQTKTKVDIETVPAWESGQNAQWTKIREIPTGDLVSSEATAQNFLQRGHISFMSTDDLMVIAPSQQRVDIVRQYDVSAGKQQTVQMVAGDMVATRLDTAAPATAVLPLPQKLNGHRSLLMLQSGSAAPTVVPLAVTATILVDRTDDPNGGSLAAASVCGAGGSDCSLRGAVQFANANPGTVITFPAGAQTYVLNTNGTNGCVNESLATGNTIGDLEVNQTTTFTGNGAALTVIRQGAATNDRVLCMDVTLAPGFTWTFSGITFTGGRDVNSNIGGGGFIGGAKTTTLNLTSVTFANNQTTGPNISGGGGVAVTGGDMNVTTCTFGAANLPGANRNDLTLGNAANNNSAGGISYSPGDPLGVAGATGTLTITGSTFTHNQANNSAAGGGGIDTFAHNLSTGTMNLSGSTLTNNQGTGTASGGGLYNESLTTDNISTTSFTNNSANRGGGIHVGGGSVVLNGTTPTITFSGNTSTVAGSSSIFTGSTLTVMGTNTTIGGDIEVATNGTWTNNAGSSLAPTNILVDGGVFNCNNSSMDIGGNLTIQPGAVVGATFNANSGTNNIAGNFSFTSGGAGPATSFNAGTGSFIFDGNTAQSISNNASITFNNLTDSNVTQPLTFNNSLAVNGTFNLNGANTIFAPVAAAVISGTGTLTGSGTARVTRTAATPDFSSQYTITNKTISSMTVEYRGAAAQTVSALTYNNLTLNNASGATLAAGTTTVNGTLTLTTGALNVSTNTLTLNNGTSVSAGTLTSLAAGTVNYNQSSVGQSVLAGIYGNLTFSNFNKVLASSGIIGVAGTFTPGTATGHTITGSTFNFNGAAAQTVPAFNYNNLQITGARTINTSVTLANGGTIGIAGTFQPTATFSGTGAYITTNNTVDFNGTAAQGVAAFNFNNLTISGNKGGGAVTLINGGTIGVAGTFSLTATNNTYVVTGNTFTFNGAALQTIPAFTFNNLILNNAAGAGLGGAVTAGGALTLTSGTLAVGTNTLTLNGAVSATAGTLTSAATGTVSYNQSTNGQATVLAADYGNLTFSNFNKTLAGAGTIGIFGTFTPGTATGHTITGSTINFKAVGAQSIPGFTYNNLTSSGGAQTRTLDPVNTIKIAGAFTPGTDVYTITGSTIEYNGTSAQALNAAFTTYNNLTLNNAAGTSGFSGLTVQGLIEVKAGTFTSSSTYNNVQIDSGTTLAATAASTINVSGNWTNNGGTFTASTGTVNFNGAGAQIIGGTVGQTFNNLTNSNAAGVTMNFDNTVNGVLALTSGDITVAATKTLIQPAAGSSTGTFDVNGRVQRSGFVSGGAALSFGNPFNTIRINVGTVPTNIVVDLARTAPAGFAGAVTRTYTITPTGGSGITATLRLHYLDAELNGNIEASLILRRFNGTGWAPYAATTPVDTANNWVENNVVQNFSPWTLSSCCLPTGSSGAISGRITTPDGRPVEGAVVNLGGDQSRKTITDANGNYHFDEVGTGGFYTVTPSRANFSFAPFNRSFSQSGNQTQAVFTGDPGSDSANPLDTAEYFVRQQYVDVLGREPEEAGFNYWSDKILACGSDAGCVSSMRRDVAAAFFISDENQASGSFIYDVYAGSLGRRPAFSEFTVDRTHVVGGSTLDADKTAFAQSFVQRAEFVTRYQNANSADAFVDAMLQSVQATGTNLSSERSNLIGIYGQGVDQLSSRAAVLRSIADNATFKQSQYNPAFVLTEYFSYLRRDAEPDGFAFWVGVLTNGGGGAAGNYRGMVCSFVTAAEYQNRFSQIVSHSNGECSGQ